MNGHTPGPWRLSYDDDDGAHVIEMGPESRGSWQSQHRIEYEHGLYPDEERPKVRAQFDEAEANARLIATAPEMYDAIMASAGLCIRVGDGNNPSSAPAAQLYGQLRALLNKIDGAA